MSTVTMQPPTSSLGWSLAGRIRAMFNTYRIRQEHRHAAMNLAELNDYLLKDIGISRSEIHAGVYGLSTDRWRGNEDKAV